ncbi:hypothetical protein P7D22_14520 [Lichenihabitans sp. Uapishka_5]|uniref:D-apionate lactonase n=1 Tax=Lichenihabitans sp. Uapishka_5 TaxID=3037302 RepID=UPI0029E7E5E8|nr:hypothetical protein [Lichenihabitans sp. Uapishka_5]MDX7952382.1 hypothetical protein [Lichenihabitans sp. Uapishka_5]
MVTLDDTDALLRFGTTEPRPAVTALRAGSLTAELVDGALRAIRWRDREVLRGIAYVVRDRDWGTVAPVLHDVVIAQDAAGFRVDFAATCAGAGGAILRTRASLSGRPDGTLTFMVEAVPDRDFETNRCGFCVLHPIVDVAGRAVSIEHVDGSLVDTCFPDAIAPWQPFKNMRAISHEVSAGLRATCRMEGDTFEMEDQRNWSDASFKTYVRPLALPWPYRLPGGVVQRQAVTLTIAEHIAEHAAMASSSVADPVTALHLGPVQGRMPRIGLVMTPDEAEAVLRQADRLREVGPQVLLFSFDPTAGHGAAALDRFAAIRALLPTAEAVLECVLPGEGESAGELREAAALLRRSGLSLDAVTVSPAADRRSTPPGSAWPACPPLATVYAAAREAFPGLRIGGGMVSYFTELNRKRPPVEGLDFVTHCTCPIVHAADDESVMQSLEALPFIVRSARTIMGAKPYRIGPATIGMRQNPYGSRTFDNPDGLRRPMTHDDPRQRGLFAAAWTIGYAAETAEAGLDVLTPGALTGAFGLVGPGHDDRAVHPVFHAVKGLAALAGAERLGCRSTRPDRVLGVAARRNGCDTLWVANITEAPQRMRVPPKFTALMAIDHVSWPIAARGETPAAVTLEAQDLVLQPYGIARIET